MTQADRKDRKQIDRQSNKMWESGERGGVVGGGKIITSDEIP